MTRNTLGGKKFKSSKKVSTTEPVQRKLELKEKGQDYGYVTKLLGNKRVMVLMNDGKEALCRIPGVFRKKVWVASGDIVLVSYRDYQDDKSDLVHKYLPNEVKKLVSTEQLNMCILDKLELGREEDDIEFADEDDESNSSNTQFVKISGEDFTLGRDEIDIDDL
jgi:translation initiation factor 1A